MTRPTIAIEPCKAGFDGCEAMRREAIAKHPRTPRLVPLTADEALTAGGGPLTEGMVLA